MYPSYIPATDSGLDTWANNFQTVIAANPAAYGLTAADATSITAAYNSYHSAYILLTAPATKTPTNVAAKNVAKASTLVTLRSYAQIIGANAGVSADAKAAAGLTVRASGRTPIPAPATIPILGLVSQQPALANIGYADSATPTTKAKPFGAIQMQLAYSVAPTGTPSPDTATLGDVVTKSPFKFNTPAGATGKAIYIWGRWVTRRGLVGPWSASLQITGT